MYNVIYCLLYISIFQPIDLKQWLQKIHYSKYYEILSENGFDDLDYFYDLEIKDLRGIGIPEEDCVMVSFTKEEKSNNKTGCFIMLIFC